MVSSYFDTVLACIPGICGWKPPKSGNRETVRVAKEQIEKDSGFHDKYRETHPTGGNPNIGQAAIAEYLGGPWKRS
jgi:hypothetical protein